jgi:hypothetical protein
MYIPDLACRYYNRKKSDNQVTAIGWLEGDQPFTHGIVSATIFEKLVAVCRTDHMVGMYMGYHECTICPKQEIQYYEGMEFPLGNRNYVIPGQGDTVYHFPDLILHYIRDHGYAPPAEFCAAVEACPDPESAEYIERVERFFSIPMNKRHLISARKP